jgi:hypothetical protein
MSEPERDLAPGAGKEGLFDEWLRSVYADSLLWPVLVVSVLTVSTFGAAMVTSAVWDRNVFSMAAMALLAGLTLFALDPDVRKRRIGPVSGLLIALWLISLIGAYVLQEVVPAPIVAG